MAMLIAWTTLPTEEEATRLARAVVERGLAVCVQIDGPLTSVYRWEGRIETGREFRLMIKFSAAQSAALEAHVHAAHPYSTPEWVVVNAEHVGEKYLSWAQANANSSPF